MCVSTSCRQENKSPSVMFGQADNGVQSMSYDLDDVQASGELIAATLSGPDTYYEYRGQGFGLQFAMAEAFANRMGARLRMEMASDTAQLIAMLSAGDVDLIALELDSTLSDASLRLMPNGWGVRANSSQLASAIVKWWNPDIRQQLLATEQSNKMAANRVRRHMQPALLSRSTGTISRYDAHFIRAAQRIGWDWRLLAAQCYQESGFDPQAVSWAGACGLMQIMPSTGERLGLSRDDLFDPSRNIEAAARYISQLNSTFSDIHNAHERIWFVLAAYNGGTGHIRDAIALAKADDHSSQRWDDVEPYVLALSSPAAYRHPLVQFGYLRGDETVDYVRQIHRRWLSYRGIARPHSSGTHSAKSSSRPSRVRSRSEFMNDSVH